MSLVTGLAPTHTEIAAIDRSLPLYVVVENRTTTPKIGVMFEPDTDNGKHFTSSS